MKRILIVALVATLVGCATDSHFAYQTPPLNLRPGAVNSLDGNPVIGMDDIEWVTMHSKWGPADRLAYRQTDMHTVSVAYWSLTQPRHVVTFDNGRVVAIDNY